MEQGISFIGKEPPSYWQETAPTLTLSSPLPTKAGVVIIGGGLMGVATCYWLAKAGIPVLLLFDSIVQR